VYNASGKGAEAISELKRALQLAPNSDDGYRGLGKAYLSLGQKDLALQAYEKAVEINPYYWVNYNSIGSAYSELGQYEDALVAFRKMIELEPDNSFGYLNVGVVYFQQGKYEQCIPFFQKSLQVQPHSLAYTNLGTAFFFLKRYAESVPMFEKAAEMNQNDPMLVGNLADAYRWSGQLDRANTTYEKAISLAFKQLQVNPRDANMMDQLSLYYAKKGDAVHAGDFIRRARAINSTDVGMIYDEAVVYTLTGRPAEALKSLQEALKKGYSVQEAQNDPELASLQGRPEFAKLVAGFGKPNKSK
jgi:tetratricopeptide (TPR) repeat protein